jgi:hypothetical protein
LSIACASAGSSKHISNTCSASRYDISILKDAASCCSSLAHLFETGFDANAAWRYSSRDAATGGAGILVTWPLSV